MSDFTQRIEAGGPVVGVPHLAEDRPEDGSGRGVELAVDDRTWALLSREAARQGATLSELITHSVLVYLAEFDRLTPPGSAAA